MSIRKAAAQFFQNIADYLNPEQELLLVPDFLTGRIHNLTDPEQQRQYRNLHRFVNNGFSDDLVIVMEGQTLTARYKNSVPHLPSGEVASKLYAAKTGTRPPSYDDLPPPAGLIRKI
ncbi:hypothetical protein [Dyadobacter psychrotolerans]|uniref:Uncharacterized protein n=1 Tax=Dyadobacter psychrotolerans TaxID=2541721 RepID=A0A4R5DBY9_9BACT|nr:hypothetical protein [Dyadobacter psychrotolerans]TDE08055.1 hypothetical protein E0F88_33255 [Dyadobacter psychrotolerans]